MDGALTDLNGTGPFPGHVTLSADGNTTVAGSTGIYLGIAVTAARASKGIYKINDASPHKRVCSKQKPKIIHSIIPPIYGLSSLWKPQYK